MLNKAMSHTTRLHNTYYHMSPCIMMHESCVKTRALMLTCKACGTRNAARRAYV